MVGFLTGAQTAIPRMQATSRMNFILNEAVKEIILSYTIFTASFETAFEYIII